MRSASLKQRVFALIIILSTLPIACFAVTAFSMMRGKAAEQKLDAANKGAVYIARINGDVTPPGELILRTRFISRGSEEISLR